MGSAVRLSWNRDHSNSDNLPLKTLGSKLFKLSSNETSLFNLLNEAASNLARSRNLDGLDLRVAGGWVRDKIMSLETSDIDIATDKVSGEDMAFAVQKLVGSRHAPAPRVYRVKVNPEKSKHIESASVKIGDITVDFTRLRSEKYTYGSRTPVTKPGDCYTDSLRRDLTINALFYNLRTGYVEDYTGRGIRDIKNKEACTPADPSVTFGEDPLRILRLIRFAAKFGLSYDRGLLGAVKQENIKSAFRMKVSRERINIEVIKMLENTGRRRAIEELMNFGLYEDIFVPDEYLKKSSEYAALWLKVTEVILLFCKLRGPSLKPPTPQKPSNSPRSSSPSNKSDLGAPVNLNKIVRYFPSDGKDIAHMCLAAAFYPVYLDLGHGKREKRGLEDMIMSQIKTSSKDASWIKSLLDAMDILDTFDPNTKRIRVTAGKIVLSICEKIAYPTKWEQCVVFAAAVKAAIELSESGGASVNVEDSMPSIIHSVRNYSSFLKVIEEEKLQSCYQIKPCLKGTEISSILKLEKPGPIIRDILNNVLLWQIEDSQITQEECKERVLLLFKDDEYKNKKICI